MVFYLGFIVLMLLPFRSIYLFSSLKSSDHLCVIDILIFLFQGPSGNLCKTMISGDETLETSQVLNVANLTKGIAVCSLGPSHVGLVGMFKDTGGGNCVYQDLSVSKLT